MLAPTIFVGVFYLDENVTCLGARRVLAATPENKNRGSLPFSGTLLIAVGRFFRFRHMLRREVNQHLIVVAASAIRRTAAEIFTDLLREDFRLLAFLLR